MSEIITVRDLDIITAEINSCKRTIVYSVIEIGRLLVEAKEITGHGGWGKYLEDYHPEIKQQTATNWMNLYKEYGTGQRSLFDGFVNSQVFGKISTTNHVELLKLPAEERLAFVEANDVENMTVKELQAAIRERDANLQTAQEQSARADRAEAKAVEMGEKVREVEDQLDLAEGKILARDETIKQLKAQADVATKKEADAAGKVDKLTKQLKAAKDAEKAAKEALAEAKAKPEIPESMMEEMRQQVAADAAAKATEDLQKQLEAAQIAAADAESRRVAAEEKVAEAEKKAQLSNPDMVLVSTYLQGTQEQFNKMIGALKKVMLADPGTGAKLKENVKSKLLESMIKAVDAV